MANLQAARKPAAQPKAPRRAPAAAQASAVVVPFPGAALQALQPGVMLQRKGCACGGSCPRCADEEVRRKVQPKLRVGAIDDAYEHEADRIARQVLGLSSQPAPSALGPGPGPAPTLRRTGAEPTAPSSSVPPPHHADAGPEPTEGQVRAWLKSQGVDFKKVKRKAALPPEAQDEIWDAEAWQTYLTAQEQVFADTAEEIIPGFF